MSCEHDKRERQWNPQGVESAAFHFAPRGEAHAQRDSALCPGGIFLPGTQKAAPTNLEYFYLRVPSCRALPWIHRGEWEHE